MVLRVLLSWIALCAAGGTAFSEVASPAPTAADAESFVARVESEWEKADEYTNRVGWIHDTNITEDTQWLEKRAKSEAANLKARNAKEATRFDSIQAEPITRRKLDIIKRATTLPPPSQLGASEELADIMTRLSERFSKKTVLHRHAKQTYDTLNEILGSSRD